MGLSGLGDLVLTATSPHSRNLAFGIALARNHSPAELLRADAPLAEGAMTARIAATLAEAHGIDAPIIAAVAALVGGRISVEAAIAGLVNRPLKRETG
jgi:glycerol-3-phosphate dehydrogenase (NAD(P)+)